jgi:hypothetical protein
MNQEHCHTATLAFFPSAAKNDPNPWRYVLLVAWVAFIAVCTGCYDSRALVEQVRSDALRNRLHEVDLGVYRTTMPRNPSNNTLMEMELHLFGTVPQYRIPAIETQLKTEGYRLRYETLAAIRETKAEELAEPDLAQLRSRLTKVVNGVLTEAPIKSIGFEEFKIVYD